MEHPRRLEKACPLTGEVSTTMSHNLFATLGKRSCVTWPMLMCWSPRTFAFTSVADFGPDPTQNICATVDMKPIVPCAGVEQG